ncbi:MAG: methyltransferase domain-containing protein [Polyangiaceae bacterium]
MRRASSFGAACALAISCSACGTAQGVQPGAEPQPTAHATSHEDASAAHAPHAHHHGHGHGHHGGGPLVHDFKDAERWAKDFDNPERDAWQKPAEVVTLLRLTPGMKVADIGAGTGYFEPHLSRAVGPTGKVLALDVEDDMVKYLGARITRESLTNVTAQKVAFDDPGLAAASVDRILVVDTWHHIANREAYCAKLATGLAPGGFVAVVDFTMDATHGPPKEHRILPEQVKKELESAGLTGEIAVESLQEQYVVLGRKAAK